MFLKSDQIHIFLSGNNTYLVLQAIFHIFTYLVAALAIGNFLLRIFFISNEDGKIKSSKTRLNYLLIAWLISQICYLVFQIALLFQVNFLQSFNPTNFSPFLSQSGLGESELLSLISTFFAILLINLSDKIINNFFGFLFSLLAAISPTFQSHSTSLSNHELAQGSLVIHVLSFLLWIGVLFAGISLNQSELEKVIGKISVISWWAAISVVITGVINTVLRLPGLNSWKTLYALLIIGKIMITIFMLGFGWAARKKLKEKLIPAKREIFWEFLLALTVITLGGWLNSTNPPTPTRLFEPAPGYLITGINPPPAPNLFHLLFSFNLDGLFFGLFVFVGLLYFKGTRTLKVRGIIWPKYRIICFVGGWVLGIYTTCGGLSIYAHYSFAYHMIAHMFFGMGVPILWSLSAPITLALRTLPAGLEKDSWGPRQILSKILNSKYVQFITNPIVALGILDGSLFALYFTPLFGNLMSSHTGHFLMNLHFLLAGMLFFYLIIGIDPNPHPVPFIGRIVLLGAAMSIHSFFSIAILSSTSLMDHGYFASLSNPWLGNLLNDQHSAGAIGWALSDLPILFALIATFIQWVREDKKETIRIERKSKLAHDLGQDDDLDKFNKYLSNLSKKNLD